MQARIYNFPKRLNSTAVPSVNAEWTPDVNLKKECSLENPQLLLGSPRSAEEIHQYNYLELAGAYYFINDWISVRDSLWQCSCTIDLLATYRNQVLATNAFVEYSSGGNPMIIDHRLPTLTSASYAANVSAFQPTRTQQGNFVLSCTGADGSIAYFAMFPNDLEALLNRVTDWMDTVIDGGDIIDVVKQWGKQAISVDSAASNIRSCMWVPWTVPGSTQLITLGTFETQVAGRKINNPIISNVATIPIPWQASDWRRCGLCHTFGLFLPFAGNVAIDAGLLAGQSSITVSYAVDSRTGDVSYIVYAGLSCVGAFGGNAGVSTPIGVSNISPVRVIGGIFTAASGIAGGSALAAGAGIAAAATNMIIPNMTSIGTISGGASAGMSDNDDITLWSVYHNTNVAPSSVGSVIGVPLMANTRIGSLSGYVKTRGASVVANTGEVELTRINGLLDGGVFIE